MTSNDRFDLIVIGCGPAGAKGGAQAPIFGKRVAITGDTAGMLKLIFARADKKLLGASIIGENATEFIHIAMIVVDNGLTIDEFIEQVFNYPPLSETYKYAAYDGLGNQAGHNLREG